MSVLVMIILVWLCAKLICPGFGLLWFIGWVFGNLLRILGLVIVVLVVLALVT